MFDFVVKNLRGLAAVPLVPHIFEGMLMVWTWIAHPARLCAMEALEDRMTGCREIELHPHTLGGTAFVHTALGELGHIHGNGLLDVRLNKATAQALRTQGRVKPHHVLPKSGWVSFPLRSLRDVSFAVWLLDLAERTECLLPQDKKTPEEKMGVFRKTRYCNSVGDQRVSTPARRSSSGIGAVA